MSSIKQDVFAEIANFLDDRYDIDVRTLSEQTSLFSGEGGIAIDSLDLVAIAQVMEDKYGVNLDDERVTTLETIGDLIAFVEGKVAEAA